MTEVSKVGQTQAAGVQQPQTQMKAEEKIKIFEGMTVNDVEQNGSEAQKIVAKAFDSQGVKPSKANNYSGADGKYSEREAEDFNNYTFALDKNARELRAYNKKTGCTSIIKYNDIEELQDNAVLLKQASRLKGGTITYDFRNKTTTFDGVSTGRGSLHVASRGKNDKVIIRNSDVRHIDAYTYQGNIQLENVKKLGTFWDSPTKITMRNDATIQADSQSQVEIRRVGPKE